MLVFFILLGLSFVGTIYSLMKHTEACIIQDKENVSYYRRTGLVCSVGVAVFIFLTFLK